jgi:hypothetical protein
MRKETKLTRFLAAECANYGKHYALCVSDEPCDVLAGKRCGYFEKAVLGPVDYPYRLLGFDYGRLFGEYAALTRAKVGMVKQRRCECGEPLRMRERYCQKCRIQRRRQSYRNTRRAKCLVRHS